eukprot:677787-Alexandrium_andersonii.AAC.1
MLHPPKGSRLEARGGGDWEIGPICMASAKAASPPPSFKLACRAPAHVSADVFCSVGPRSYGRKENRTSFVS